MTWAPCETVARVAPHVPGELVSPGALERILSLSQRLPHGWGSYYIECRLDPGEQQVDFLAGVGGEGREELHRSLALLLREGELDAPSSWQRFAELCAAWREPGSELHAQVPALWLELDGAGHPAPASPSPSFCVCVAQEYRSPRTLAADPERAWSALVRSLRCLLPGVESATLRRLERTVAALPPGGQLIHLSVMLGRSPAAAKLYVAVPRRELSAYLHEIGYPGALDDVAALTREPFPEVEPVYLDLTISDAVSSRIGLAFSQLHLRGPGQATRDWGGLLDLCVERGACCPEKRAALGAWTGSERVCFDGERWPVRLHRYLDVKLVVAEGKPLLAKAYLGFQPRAAFL
ncbi:hypothetical protein [Sorangium sp. So ce385]|uniref:hypothetical protein n=1 Tax=Sorangium sp. So ce385 TaxID=3133308 RepID=UPI003F5C8EAD